MNPTVKKKTPVRRLRGAGPEALNPSRPVPPRYRHAKILASNRARSAAGQSPLTDSLRGVVSLPPDLPLRNVVEEEILRSVTR
jgi:hypothetical protein